MPKAVPPQRNGNLEHTRVQLQYEWTSYKQRRFNRAAEEAQGKL